MNIQAITEVISKTAAKRPEVKVGDTVKLHMNIKEGDKQRVQVFEGTIISMRGSANDRTITVRKMSYGVGVERIVPLNSPTLEKLEVIKRGKVRKSKLYYMKRKVGKRALKVDNVSDVYFTDEVEQEVVETSDSPEASQESEVAQAEVEKEEVKE